MEEIILLQEVRRKQQSHSLRNWNMRIMSFITRIRFLTDVVNDVPSSVICSLFQIMVTYCPISFLFKIFKDPKLPLPPNAVCSFLLNVTCSLAFLF